MKLLKIKKPNRKLLVKKLDKAFSEYIRYKHIKEYGNICPFCKRNPIEHCFHFLSRISHSTRWREDNAIGSCSGCNFLNEHEPSSFITWFIDNRGRDKLEFLQGLWHESVKFSNYDLELMEQDFKKRLTDLKNEI